MLLSVVHVCKDLHLSQQNDLMTFNLSPKCSLSQTLGCLTKLLPCPGLTTLRKHSKHFSDRWSNVQSGGSHKTAVCVVWCHHKKNERKKKSTEGEELEEEEEGGKV